MCGCDLLRTVWADVASATGAFYIVWQSHLYGFAFWVRIFTQNTLKGGLCVEPTHWCANRSNGNWTENESVRSIMGDRMRGKDRSGERNVQRNNQNAQNFAKNMAYILWIRKKDLCQTLQCVCAPVCVCVSVCVVWVSKEQFKYLLVGVKSQKSNMNEHRMGPTQSFAVTVVCVRVCVCMRLVMIATV